MKYFLFLFLSGLLYVNGFAQPIDPAFYSLPVNVASIGNSITFGSGIADRPHDSYPAQLGRMLGDHWIVRNFGVGGRTMLKKGDFPYWKEDARVEAKSFLSDVVIIKLGTNDTKPQNWKYAGVDFILNSYPQIPLPLDSRDYHSYRTKLHNAQIVFEREKHGRVAFLGGSITFNGGWRDSICSYLQKLFPNTQFDFVAAGIPSMGSTPGAFRFERDVLGKGKVDLLFEEAAVNDRANGFSTETQVLGMEGIVRHARESNPAIEVVVMHFVDPDKMADYRKGIVPTEIQNHEKVAAHYGISTINLAKEVTDRIDNGEFSWEKDFKNLHPSPFGQHIYFRSMKSFLDFCWSGYVAEDDKLTAYPIPGKLAEGCYNKGKLLLAVGVKPGKGWRVETNWIPSDKSGTRPDFTDVPMLVAEAPGGILNFSFKGNAVGIAIAAGLDAGTIEYRIDNGRWQKQDLFTTWSAQLHLPWFYTLAYGLHPGKHLLKLRLLGEKNSQSKGTACRIRYFYVNK